MAPPAALDLTPKGGAAALRAPARRAHAGGAPPRPPADGGGEDGGGGSRGRSEPEGEDAGRFALVLALLGITTLFVVLFAVALLARRPSPDWPAAVRHPLGVLWASSACLLGSSCALERAARMARDGRVPRARTVGWLAASLALGTAFVASQTAAWLVAWRGGFEPSSSGHAAVFFALTGVHALHVLGGLAFLGARLVRCVRTAGSLPAASLRLGALYWHFMGALWLVLVAFLVLV